ncbi:hypothetical protein HPB48_022609 [Haemaphysalis longicornis]|uniref:THAP-type domain-containing protein n=1 Tax=Haemaphysalis longicornis TaxID=44386 RepID=A0A9J6GDA6_HAELO|nr:hypothetical protein HPB48_022609 [Haemaphysalis longicornis]
MQRLEGFEAAIGSARGRARSFTRRLVRRARIVCNAIAALTREKHRLFPVPTVNCRQSRPQFCAGPPTVYKSSKRLSLFGVEERASILAQWRRAIPRTEKRLKENTAMCELHFDAFVLAAKDAQVAAAVAMSSLLQWSLQRLTARSPLQTSVRFWERRKYLRRHGYRNPLHPPGFLPRLPDEKEKLRSQPVYTPKDVWCERRALFGQNDYIG